jgi:glycosyltransferase involved in cell wall biosynthesis
MRRDPLISVLITARNAEAFIGQAISSAARQHRYSHEIVVVDDGSSDRTRDIVSSMAMTDPRIRLIANPARGIAASTNVGLRACTGQFIARLDADDVCMPGRLAFQASWLLRHPRVICVSGAYIEIGPDGSRLSTEVIRPVLGFNRITKALCSYNPICHSTAMIRASALRHIHGYDESFPCALDYDLWVRLCRIGIVAQIPLVMSGRRVSGSMISIQRRRRQIWNSFRSRHRHFLRFPPTPTAFAAMARDIARTLVPAHLTREIRALTRSVTPRS